jgi:hypothetical protein
MNKEMLRAMTATAVVLAASTFGGYQVHAADEPSETKKETDRLKEEADRYKEEANLITQRSALEKARVDALRLPSYTGTTTINTGALTIESWMLASTAMDGAAAYIKNALPSGESSKKILVLAGSEGLDFGQVGALETQMKALSDSLQRACGLVAPTTKCKPTEVDTLSVGVATAAIGAAAGLLRQNTELTGVNVELESRVLAAAVAAKLDKGVIPTAATAFRVTDQNDLLTQFNDLVFTAEEARKLRDLIAKKVADKKKVSAAEKAALADINALLPRYDALYTKLTTPETSGAVPLASAARLKQLLKDDPLVLRVYIEKAGGTVLKRENVLTMLGADPVAVSGGLIASYQLTNPYDGDARAFGMVTCRTALTRLRRVQDGTWRAKPEKSTRAAGLPKAICEPKLT